MRPLVVRVDWPLRITIPPLSDPTLLARRALPLAASAIALDAKLALLRACTNIDAPRAATDDPAMNATAPPATLTAPVVSEPDPLPSVKLFDDCPAPLKMLAEPPLMLVAPPRPSPTVLPPDTVTLPADSARDVSIRT